MTDNDKNMRDLTAMFAMSGLLMRGGSYADSVNESFKIADYFMKVRDEHDEEEGIAAIKREQP